MIRQILKRKIIQRRYYKVMINNVDPSSEEFINNHKEMDKIINEMNTQLEKIKLGQTILIFRRKQGCKR